MANVSTLRATEFWCICDDTEAGTVRLTLAGELDIGAVPELDRALRDAEAVSTTIFIDLRELEHMDSCGALLLVSTDRRLRQSGGGIVLGRAREDVEWFLSLIGIDRPGDGAQHRPFTAAAAFRPSARAA
jgi:anti-anti-sigma factor